MSKLKPSRKKARLVRAMAAGPLIAILATLGACSGKPRGAAEGDNPARLRPGVRNRIVSGGWNYATYPYPQTAESGRTITIADLKGPGQINTIHFSGPILGMYAQVPLLVLEITFDGAARPAVSVPLGEFFADAGNRSAFFSTAFVEKTPDAWTCYFPMPFKKSARLTLRNDTQEEIFNYSYVEWQTLPEWDESMAYFHASWRRPSFQLTPDTRLKVFTLPGPGHLVGEYWCINTDEPMFQGMDFVMEANKEFRVDGEKEPSINYLGSEDSFNFSWGWHALFNGTKAGINHLNFRLEDGFKAIYDENQGTLSTISTYRFRDRDVLRFDHSLEQTLDWSGEFRHSAHARSIVEKIRERNRRGGGWVDYAITTYWYSSDPNGLGLPVPSAEEREKRLLHGNPPAE